ncbi:MAG: hypothetical protein ACREJO_00165 [Phycisphaerales bacterium]
MQTLEALDRPVIQNRGIPTVRLHAASSQFLTTIDSKAIYLGKDLNKAWTAFLPFLKAWRHQTGRKNGVTVREAGEALVETLAEQGKDTQDTVRFRLGPAFLHFGHGTQIEEIGVDEVEAFRTHLVTTYKPHSTIGYLSATKRMLRYAAYKGWRQPIELSFISNPKLAAPLPKHKSIAEVGGWLDKADDYHAQLGKWLRVMLATGARPSECVSLAWARGTWLEESVFALEKSKTTYLLKTPRVLIVLPEIRKVLHSIQASKPRWCLQSSFAHACAGAFDSRPHALRHTAAYLAHRVPGAVNSREDTDMWLGHAPSYISRVYNVIDVDRLKRVGQTYLNYLQATMPKHFPVV